MEVSFVQMRLLMIVQEFQDKACLLVNQINTRQTNPWMSIEIIKYHHVHCVKIRTQKRQDSLSCKLLSFFAKKFMLKNRRPVQKQDFSARSMKSD